MHTAVNACHCTRRAVRIQEESALKVDFGRKIPHRTGESNLPQRRAGSMLYQLSYILICVCVSKQARARVCVCVGGGISMGVVVYGECRFCVCEVVCVSVRGCLGGCKDGLMGVFVGVDGYGDGAV